jgi:hypothetical protein
MFKLLLDTIKARFSSLDEVEFSNICAEMECPFIIKQDNCIGIDTCPRMKDIPGHISIWIESENGIQHFITKKPKCVKQ